MSEGDPTDDAVAATDQPEVCLAEEIPTTTPAAPNPASDCAETDSYTKYGPGPLAAVRFKWTTRRDENGDYFVDETIGDSSYPLVSGPMTKEAAIKFVDDRERDACQRFETLRSEMAGGEIGPRDDE